MSGGGSGGSTQSGPPAWAVPYYQDLFNRAGAQSKTPYQAYGGQTVAQFDPAQQQGLQMQQQRALAGSPVNDAASSELQKTLSGSYLSEGNPYLTGVIDKAQGDVVRNYTNAVRPALDSVDARSGSFGNSGVAQTGQEQQRQLGETLAGISTNLRGTDYANERNRMQGAIGMAPTIANQDYVDANQLIGVGDARQKLNQANLDDAYARFNEAKNYPQQQLSGLASILSGTGGGGQTSTSTSGKPSAASATLGGGATGAAAGSMFGPWGAAIGGGLGAASGYASSK